jgi:hypothetical protein
MDNVTDFRWLSHRKPLRSPLCGSRIRARVLQFGLALFRPPPNLTGKFHEGGSKFTCKIGGGGRNNDDTKFTGTELEDLGNAGRASTAQPPNSYTCLAHQIYVYIRA